MIKSENLNKTLGIVEVSNFKNWEQVATFGEYDTFYVSEDGKSVCIKDENKDAALKRVTYTIEIENGKTYKVSAAYESKNVKHSLSVYALLTLMSDNETVTRRLYMNEAGNTKELIFTSSGETKIRIELGIKTFGEVVWHLPVICLSEPLPKRLVKIAATHITCNEKSYKKRLEVIGELFDKAAARDTDIVLFPEAIGTVETDIAEIDRYQTLEGEISEFIRRKCREHSCYAYFSLNERTDDGVRYNAAVLVDRNGEIVISGKKTHLALVEYEKGVIPGENYCVADVDFGRIGLLICWDAYFPEPARVMAYKGAELLLISTAGNCGLRHIVRAKENGVYVAVSCSGYTADGVLPTKIIDPCGKILAATEAENSIAFAEIDLDEKKYIRWLSLGDCNADVHNVCMNEYRPDLLHELISFAE